MKNTVLVLNLDTVKNKNIYQFNEMKAYGFTYLVFGYLKDQATIYSCNYSYFVYPKSALARIITIFKTILLNRKKIHHVELYTGGGSFLGLEFILCRLLGLKICVIERGSPLLEINTHYNLIGRLTRKFLYISSTYVWIRELWMKQALCDLGRKSFFFLSNSVEVSDQFSFSPSKKIDFIWCNSLKKWRNSDWFVDSLHIDFFNRAKIVMLGFLENNLSVREQQEYAKHHKTSNIELLPFQQPSSYFLDSKFFVLPANIVYLNFSLLEAMSHGVVPIVSDVDGAREIVRDGINGILANHSKKGLQDAMIKAMSLSDQQYEMLARGARETVIEKFSIQSWAVRLNMFYSEMYSK